MLDTIQARLIRTNVDGDELSDTELRILQQGANFVHSAGSFHGGELEGLLIICREKTAFRYPNPRSNSGFSYHYHQLSDLFIDSVYTPLYVVKRVTVAVHLDRFPDVMQLLDRHYAECSRLLLEDWRFPPLTCASLWKLREHEIVTVVTDINSLKLKSNTHVRFFIKIRKDRKKFLVCFYFFHICFFISFLFSFFGILFMSRLYAKGWFAWQC